jgi:hypothetical protein
MFIFEKWKEVEEEVMAGVRQGVAAIGWCNVKTIGCNAG